VGKLNLHLVKEAFLHEEVRTRLDGVYGGRGRDIGRTTETKKLVKIINLFACLAFCVQTLSYLTLISVFVMALHLHSSCAGTVL